MQCYMCKKELDKDYVFISVETEKHTPFCKECALSEILDCFKSKLDCEFVWE